MFNHLCESVKLICLMISTLYQINEVKHEVMISFVSLYELLSIHQIRDERVTQKAKVAPCHLESDQDLHGFGNWRVWQLIRVCSDVLVELATFSRPHYPFPSINQQTTCDTRAAHRHLIYETKNRSLLFRLDLTQKFRT